MSGKKNFVSVLLLSMAVVICLIVVFIDAPDERDTKKGETSTEDVEERISYLSTAEKLRLLENYHQNKNKALADLQYKDIEGWIVMVAIEEWRAFHPHAVVGENEFSLVDSIECWYDYDYGCLQCGWR